jgi:hypothetical protein
MSRNVTDAESGHLHGQRYLLHDRDTKFCPPFRNVLRSAGVRPVVELALALPWSWRRVLLPLGVVLWHNTVQIAVGLIWLAWKGCGREGDDLRIRRRRRVDRYQLGSPVCAAIFQDNVLRRMGGVGESVWRGSRRADMTSSCSLAA